MSSQEKLLSRTFMLGFLVMILDTSCAGSFMKKTIEFRWDLLDRIKRNSGDWDLDEGKESGITPKFDCVKSFMDTDVRREFSTKYGLDSEIVASFYESFVRLEIIYVITIMMNKMHRIRTSIIYNSKISYHHIAYIMSMPFHSKIKGKTSFYLHLRVNLQA